MDPRACETVNCLYSNKKARKPGVKVRTKNYTNVMPMTNFAWYSYALDEQQESEVKGSMEDNGDQEDQKEDDEAQQTSPEQQRDGIYTRNQGVKLNIQSHDSGIVL